MVNLNLTANGIEQEKILNYLQKNASETLANKINNGVYIKKDGKRLLNKKDLNGFMQFACNEAKKLAAKNSRFACVIDDVVYGWAIHYFEEESIEGTLYNEDGTVYKKATPTQPKTTVTTKPVITKPKKNDGQISIFDMNFEDETEQDETDDIDDEDDEIDEEVKTPPSGTKQAVTETTSKAAAVTAQSPKVTEQRQIEQPKQTPQSNDMAGLFYYKYTLIQRDHPDSILFYRLGDFYEALDKSAEIASKILDLTLTGKNCGEYGRIPMCGLPYHAVDKYIDKLRNKYSVVLMHSDKELQEYPQKKFEDIVQENAEKLDAMAEDDDETLGLVIDEEVDEQIDKMSAADYSKYFNLDDYTDKTTGEIKAPKIEKDLFVILYNLFDGQIIMG